MFEPSQEELKWAFLPTRETVAFEQQYDVTVIEIREDGSGFWVGCVSNQLDDTEVPIE